MLVDMNTVTQCMVVSSPLSNARLPITAIAVVTTRRALHFDNPEKGGEGLVDIRKLRKQTMSQSTTTTGNELGSSVLTRSNCLDVATSSVLPDSKLADSEFSTSASLSLPTTQTDGKSRETVEYLNRICYR